MKNIQQSKQQNSSSARGLKNHFEDLFGKQANVDVVEKLHIAHEILRKCKSQQGPSTVCSNIAAQYPSFEVVGSMIVHCSNIQVPKHNRSTRFQYTGHIQEFRHNMA